MAARPLCWGTQRSATATTPTAASPHRLPLALREGPRKATFHQKSENVNRDAFMLFMMRYLWWQESNQLVCWVLSRPLPLSDIWNSFLSNKLSITNSYTHIKTTNLQKHIPRNFLNVWKLINSQETYAIEILLPEKVLRYGQQKRHLNKYSVCKGSC